MTTPQRAGITTFTRGKNQNPCATKAFERILTTTPELNGEVIYGYPFRRTPSGIHIVDAILVSDSGHVTVVDLVEGHELGQYQERQDASYNLVDLRLRQNPAFRYRRTLIVPLQTISYGPNLQTPDHDQEHPVATSDTLATTLLSYQRSLETQPERTREDIVFQIFTAF